MYKYIFVPGLSKEKLPGISLLGLPTISSSGRDVFICGGLELLERVLPISANAEIVIFPALSIWMNGNAQANLAAHQHLKELLAELCCFGHKTQTTLYWPRWRAYSQLLPQESQYGQLKLISVNSFMRKFEESLRQLTPHSLEIREVNLTLPISTG